ncbi:tumor necrosis factor receptor superfamily member 4 [Suncus etruscus]|uniref:tumor necrosis factor receptor superfamily member 4 n=1 Tax=Suncus etruscus TaxID=109475 RepID=UPI00210F9660|nr:tumor necrosis factor receptor superfamily member 4 [Suncus etruscus]
MQTAGDPPWVLGAASQLLCLLLLGLPLAAGGPLHCPGNTYPGGNRCCQECRPGFGMERRCDAQRDTLCRPCPTGSYNDAFNYQPCRPCTQCFHRSGSETQQQCSPTRNTICRCRPGTEPRDPYRLGVDCAPCPPGHFSPGHQQACRPWTNCSLAGKPTLRPASSTEDAVCEDQDSMATLPTHTPSTSTSTLRRTKASASQTPSSTSRGPPGGLLPAGRAMALGLGLGFLVSVAILLVLLLHCQLQRRLPCIPKTPGGNSFRTPVQEEHADGQSSLAKI